MEALPTLSGVWWRFVKPWSVYKSQFWLSVCGCLFKLNTLQFSSANGETISNRGSSSDLPQSSGGDEDHPQVPQMEGGGVDDHPHQRHEVDHQGRLPAETQHLFIGSHRSGSAPTPQARGEDRPSLNTVGLFVLHHCANVHFSNQEIFRGHLPGFASRQL